jgi:hypothetical protein
MPTKLTLVELANRRDPQGNTATIAEVLAEDNEILQDAVFQEANDVFSHTCTRRLSLPSGTWRQLNEGVANESSKTIKVTEGIGMLESYSEPDKVLVDAAPNPQQFRMDEGQAFIEGMSQTLAATMIYGNAQTDPTQFTGLAVRMNALAPLANVIGSGGTGGDDTSIYIVQWGLNKVFMIYPKGHPTVGVEHSDKGQVTLQDGSGNNYEGYRDHFAMRAGLVVKDDRCIARLANITPTGTSNIFDEDNLIKLLNRMPMRGRGASIYANETVLSQMEIALKDKANVNYTPARGEGLAGEPMMYFRTCPVRKVDAILNTEATIA